MTAMTLEYSLSELLERAGCALRGHNRADCAKCKGRRTVSYSDEVFCCHHAGCDFRGNRITLAKGLGLLRPLSPGEYQALRQTREEAERLARYIVEKRKARRWGVQARHRQLLSIKLGARERLKRNSEDEHAWGALALAYRELPQVQQELDRFESQLI
jgi:hypothetical protein